MTVEELRPGSAPPSGDGPGSGEARTVAALLQSRLYSLTELGLTLTHIRWNVTGADVPAVHTLLNPQVDAVRLMADAVAERILGLGGVPLGTPGALVAQRDGADYGVGRATSAEHLQALDAHYGRVIDAHRGAINATEQWDPITQDLLIEQVDQLESFHWFVRSYLDQAGAAPR